MLKCEPLSPTTAVEVASGFRIRLRGADVGEQVFVLPRGRTTIGSSPRCNVRVEQPGVHPLHCLILYAADQLSARRWADDCTLNGQPFDEAPLAPGDCLTVGAVELVIESVEPTVQPADEQDAVVRHCGDDCDFPQEYCEEQSNCRSGDHADNQVDLPCDEENHESHRNEPRQDSGDACQDAVREFAAATDDCSVWLNDDQRTPWINDPGAADESAAANAELESYRWSPKPSGSVVSFEAAKIVFRELQTATAISRGRSRKLLDALRHNRDEYRRLAERVEDVECLMQAALLEDERLRPFAEENLENEGVESTILTRSKEVCAEAVNSQVDAEEDHRAPEIERLKSELTQIAGEKHELAAEIVRVQGELAQIAEEKHELAAEIVRLQAELAKIVEEKHELAAEIARLQGEFSQITEEKQQRAAEKEALSADLDALRRQFDSAEQELARWQQADSKWRRQREKWSAERDDWARQKESFERQIAECELRLADQLQRIESLESDLAIARQSRTAPDPGFDPSIPQGTESNDIQCATSERLEQPLHEASSSPPATDIEPATATWESNNSEATPRSDSSITPSPDELARFAEFSIWQQGAATPPPAENVAEPIERPADAEDPQRPSGDPGEDLPREVQAASFIERYAHMFADDPPEASPLQPAAPVVSECHDDYHVQKPRNVGTGLFVSQPSPNEDEEESIEQYMAKLLQRVRGDTNRIASKAQPETPASGSRIQAAQKFESFDESATGNLVPLWPIPSIPVDGTGEHVTTSLGTIRRKLPLAEQSADLEAFRALANESARRAISVYASRKHCRDSVTKAIVATLAGMTSLWLMLDAPHWQDLQFLTAWVSLMAAAYWAGQAYATLLETLRAVDYDGPDDRLKDLVEALRPQLPVDAEN